jgi:hypothetical protein
MRKNKDESPESVDGVRARRRLYKKERQSLIDFAEKIVMRVKTGSTGRGGRAVSFGMLVLLPLSLSVLCIALALYGIYR